MYEANNPPSQDCDEQNMEGAQEIDKTKLIVNYLPQFMTEEDLHKLFSPLGEIEEIKVVRDHRTGYSYGFGFVKYCNIEDANKAIMFLNGKCCGNKRLKVSHSRPRSSDMKDANLYVTNLPKETTDADIDSMFGSYGEIIQRNVLKDKFTGMPRGVAFVRFSKKEEAQAAIADLDGKLLQNALFPLSVRVAEDHGRQKAQYIDQYMQIRGVPTGFRNNAPLWQQNGAPPFPRNNQKRVGNIGSYTFDSDDAFF